MKTRNPNYRKKGPGRCSKRNTRGSGKLIEQAMEQRLTKRC